MHSFRGGADVAESTATSTPATVNASAPLEIDSSGNLNGNLEEYKATYSDHVLSFNKDISVNLGDSEFFIKSEYKGLTIEFNANVTVTANDREGHFRGITCMDNTVITGSGTLTFNMPAVTSTDPENPYFCIGIGFGNNDTTVEEAIIKNLTVVVNFSTSTPFNMGIYANKHLTIEKATIKIDNTKTTPDTSVGRYESYRYALIAINYYHGIINISESDIDIKVKTNKAIGPVEDPSSELSGTVTISNSKIKITSSADTSGDTAGIYATNFKSYRSDITFDMRNGGWGCITATNDSHDGENTSVGGKCNIVESKITMSLGNNGPGRGIDYRGSDTRNVDYVIVEKSQIKCDNRPADEGSSDLINCSNVYLINSVVDDGFEHNHAPTIVAVNNIMISESVVYARGFNGDLISANSIFFIKSDIDVKSVNDYPWTPMHAPVVAISDKILATNDTSTPPTAVIGKEDIGNYMWVHVKSSQHISFNLAGGKGSIVNDITADVGETIELPKCDAKYEDREFIGWTDGVNTYKAGDEYKVSISTTMIAVYDTPATGIDTMAAIGAIAIAAIFIGVLATIFIERR